MAPALLFLVAVVAAFGTVLVIATSTYRSWPEAPPGVVRWLFAHRAPRPLELKVAFDLSPVDGVSEDLLFRAPTLDDHDVLRSIFHDPVTVAANSGDMAAWGRLLDDPQISAWRRAEWLVGERRDSGEIVGLAVVGGVPDGYREVSVGLMMRDGFRGIGFGTQLAAAMLTVLQHTFLQEIWAFTTRDNTAVQRILDRLGYAADDRVIRFDTPGGEDREWLAYACGRRHVNPEPAIWR